MRLMQCRPIHQVVSRPIELSPKLVNQRAPSGPAVMPRGSLIPRAE